MSQAIAWGYRNNIIIKNSISDNVEFFKGESLDKSDLTKLTVSYSDNIAYGYEPDHAPWEELHKLVTADDFHYCAHHFMEGHRDSEKAIPGFNLVILDIDDGISMSSAQLLLKNYKALFATTKRSTDQHNRFRIILPLSHTLKLKKDVYKQFMQNIFDWLPFEVDDQTKDIARKWSSYNGEYAYQDGELLDAMLFIPDTKKQQKQQQLILDHSTLTNLERWFLTNIEVGSRSNTLIKYAYVLVDGGYSIDAIRASIHAFNHKLPEPLSEDEINNTIMVTVVRAVTKRDQ